ncbi:hypothetical protein BGZ76_006288 [Entomortierella beljakovae]|nr:hypothetical protein BGZ76_006288 [Entomortierella beljakovae]
MGGELISDIFPLDKPTEANELQYFSDSIIKTIKEFATTERTKYPETFHMEEFGNLFSDELLDGQEAERISMGYDSCNLRKEIQSVDYWVNAAKSCSEQNPEYYKSPIYTTGDMDLASAVKYLIMKNEMAPLLMMSQYNTTPLKCLYNIHWGHSFGWSRLAEYALAAYIYFNILGEFPELCKDSKYKDLNQYIILTNHLTSPCDGDTQIMLHLPFILPPPEERANIHWWREADISRDIFSDFSRLKDYLKACFEVLYRSEMLARECGIEIRWDEEIASALGHLHVHTHDELEEQENGDTSYKRTYKNPKSKASVN